MNIHQSPRLVSLPRPLGITPTRAHRTICFKPNRVSYVPTHTAHYPFSHAYLSVPVRTTWLIVSERGPIPPEGHRKRDNNSSASKSQKGERGEGPSGQQIYSTTLYSYSGCCSGGVEDGLYFVSQASTL